MSDPYTKNPKAYKDERILMMDNIILIRRIYPNQDSAADEYIAYNNNIVDPTEKMVMKWDNEEEARDMFKLYIKKQWKGK